MANTYLKKKPVAKNNGRPKTAATTDKPKRGRRTKDQQEGKRGPGRPPGTPNKPKDDPTSAAAKRAKKDKPAVETSAPAEAKQQTAQPKAKAPAAQQSGFEKRAALIELALVSDDVRKVCQGVSLRVIESVHTLHSFVAGKEL